MMIGFALAAVGLDHMTGQLRLTFGFTELLAGFDFLIAVIGLFGIGEILLTMEEGLQFKGKRGQHQSAGGVADLEGTAALLGDLAALLHHRLLDGHHAGRRDAGLVHELRHRQAHVAKRGKNFGKGEIEGVVAPETAAHAAGTSALLPMLSLGVPGSPTAAVLLGGLLIWGLQPGPLLFVEQKEFVWGLIASMYLGNIVGLIIVLTCVPLFAAILRIPFSIIAPIILVLCAIGAYTVHNNHVRRGDDAGVRRARLRAEEMRLPAGAAGAGASCSATRPRRRSGSRCSGRRAASTIFWSNGLVGSIMAARPDRAVLADHSERHGAAASAPGDLIRAPASLRSLASAHTTRLPRICDCSRTKLEYCIPVCNRWC